MYSKHIFDSGLTLIKAPLHDTKSVTLLIMFGVGSRYEKDELSGGAHLLEHMFFKGTKKRPNTLAISKMLDAVGAEYNAFTAKDYTGYYIKLHHEKLALAVDVLSDMLLRSKFDPKELEKEKQVIVEEIKMYQENPLIYIEDFFETLLYQGTTLGRDISGTPHSVRQMDRDALLDFKARYYQPSDTVVTLAGKFDERVSDSLLKRFFERPFAGKKILREKESYPKIELCFSSEPRMKLDCRKTDQVQLGLGFPAYSYFDERFPSARLLAAILGGNMSSRLFIRVREKHGLCYSISASASAYQDTGDFLIRAGLDAGRLQQAIRVILDELVKIRKQGVTAVELKRTKEYMKGKFLLGLEDSESLAQWYCRQQLLTAQTRTPEEELERLNKVTLAQIHAVCNDLFIREKLNIAMIGPVEDEKNILDHIKDF